MYQYWNYSKQTLHNIAQLKHDKKLVYLESILYNYKLSAPFIVNKYSHVPLERSMQQSTSFAIVSTSYYGYSCGLRVHNLKRVILISVGMYTNDYNCLSH